MGICYIDGKPDDTGLIQTKADCLKSGGTWESRDGICFVRSVLTRSLGETILELGATYRIAQEFRDHVLAPTAVGARLLEGYYRNTDKTFSAAQENYGLLAAFIECWLALQPWMKGLLEASGAGEWKGRNEHSHRVRFTEADYERLRGMLDLFKNAASNRDYDRFLDDLATEAALYVGRTPTEGLEQLRREGPSSSESR